MLDAEISELSAYLEATSSVPQQLEALQSSIQAIDVELSDCHNETERLSTLSSALTAEVDAKRAEHEEAVSNKEQDFVRKYSDQMYVDLPLLQTHRSIHAHIQ